MDCSGPESKEKGVGSLHIPDCAASPSREPEGRPAAAAGAQSVAIIAHPGAARERLGGLVISWEP